MIVTPYMSFENPSESYTREQAMGAHDIEMGIPIKKTRCCWGETDKKPIIIPTANTINEDPNAVIKDLESQQIPVIQKAMATPINQAGDILMGFMSNGAKEFEKRTGRPMTYGEMRAAWG